MKYRLFAVLLVMAATTASVHAQTISGRVLTAGTGTPAPLYGASVYFPGTGRGVSTDAEGRFEIEVPAAADTLAASFVGFGSSSVRVSDIKDGHVEFLLNPLEIETVVMGGYRPGSTFSTISTQKTEMITSTGLMKMACCNLAESFENSATVTVGFTDAVSGAKQVQLLGLAGIYSQMMSENIPIMRGLASTYGWSYTPGPWLESIQISKGASSVVNGYESVSGQMNLEFKKPNNGEDLFINLFTDESGRYEANVTSSVKVADKLWTGLLLHGSIEDKAHDMNGDGFMDMPRMKFINAFNRWFYLDPQQGIESRTGLKFLYEERNGGQMASSARPVRYTTGIDNKNLAIENKTGISIGKREGQSLGLITSYSHYEQNSSFGMKSFDGRQNSFYFNALFSSYIGNPAHGYVAGASFAYDHYDTVYDDRLPQNNAGEVNLDRSESVPGIFAQYTFSPSDRFSAMAGMRVDYNSHYGWLYTPRLNVKYDLTRWLILRASAGRGYRSPNVLSDNIGLLGTSRILDVSAIDALGIERAWNFGGNISFHLPVWAGRTMTLSIDYFHTTFGNQAVVDTERDARHIYFYDLRGRSTADVWQADLSFTILKGLDFLAAFRYNDTKITLSEGGHNYDVEKPLMSRYRGLVNVSYATDFKKWVFDLTAQINGPSRLPGLAGYDSPVESSPVFPVYFVQVTKNWKRFDIYAGVENILDYKQENPILGADDPLGTAFDSSRIWGPLMGRKIYLGMRIRIGNF